MQEELMLLLPNETLQNGAKSPIYEPDKARMEFTEPIDCHACSAAYSPDGLHIACLTDSQTLTVLDAIGLTSSWVAKTSASHPTGLTWSPCSSFLAVHNQHTIDVFHGQDLVGNIHEPLGFEQLAFHGHDLLVLLRLSFGLKIYGLCGRKPAFIRGVKRFKAAGPELLALMGDGNLAVFRNLKCSRTVGIGVDGLELDRGVVYGFDAGCIKILDLKSSRPLKSIAHAFPASITSMSFSPDGTLAALILVNSEAWMFNAVTHGVIKKLVCTSKCVVFKEIDTADHRYYQAAIAGASAERGEKTALKEACFDATSTYFCLHSASSAYIFKHGRLVATLQQASPISATAWHPRLPLLLIACTDSPHLYAWQPDGVHCVPIPFSFDPSMLQWHPAGECALVTGSAAFCVIVPDEQMLHAQQQAKAEPLCALEVIEGEATHCRA